MSTILKIPFDKEFLSELEDAFIDKKETAEDFIWGEIRRLCKDAKLGKLNKSCVVSVLKNGQQIQDTIKLKDVELHDAPSDPSWIPPLVEKEDVTYYEHKITDKTLEYLELYASFSLLRHDEWANSVVKHNEELLEKMRENTDTEQKVIDDAEAEFTKTKEGLEDQAPHCLEQCIYAAIYAPIHKHVSDNIDVMFDKENEEANPKEEKSSK